MKNTTIQIRVSEFEKDMLQKEAEKLGMSLSSYLLYCVSYERIKRGDGLIEQGVT